MSKLSQFFGGGVGSGSMSDDFYKFTTSGEFKVQHSCRIVVFMVGGGGGGGANGYHSGPVEELCSGLMKPDTL